MFFIVLALLWYFGAPAELYLFLVLFLPEFD